MTLEAHLEAMTHNALWSQIQQQQGKTENAAEPPAPLHSSSTFALSVNYILLHEDGKQVLNK